MQIDLENPRTQPKLGNPAVAGLAGSELMACAGSAWYIMASIISKDLVSRDLLTVGDPWLD